MDTNAVRAPSTPEGNWAVTVRWLSAGEKTPEELPEFFESVAPAYRYRSQRYFWPSISGNVPPSPLMMWWMLLYSFSILARYEPRQWIKMLDPGKRDVAALPRFMLKAALTCACACMS